MHPLRRVIEPCTVQHHQYVSLESLIINKDKVCCKLLGFYENLYIRQCIFLITSSLKQTIEMSLSLCICIVNKFKGITPNFVTLYTIIIVSYLTLASLSYSRNKPKSVPA